MKKTYLFLAIIGFVLPNIFVAKVSVETGNILLYTNIPETISKMFANDIATAFIVDLLFIVLLFLIWSYREAKKMRMKMSKLWLVWILTFAFGIAGGLPLFLYFRENEKMKT